ncbi:MAG TPA: Rpp14/Pop5 family protein [Candidatus Norongarragalinales archaeon]|jgi:RNase P/RNase MRP subunit POP5|nr:Rpp14/Pop5 family protein [Candidatus Norongarragalinales archaeon]
MIHEKERQILAHIEAKTPLEEREAKALIHDSLLQALGEHGSSLAGAQLKVFDAKKQQVVIKCRTAQLQQVLAAFALARFWRGKDVAIRALKTSGTIAGLSR